MSGTNLQLAFHVYVRKGVAIVPDVAKTEAGFFLDVEPVRTAKIEDAAALSEAIRATIEAGNPRVQTPTRMTFPRPVVLGPAGVKSWKELMKTGLCFSIFFREDGIEVAETGRNGKGEWMDVPELSRKFPKDAPAQMIAAHIANRAAAHG